MTYYNLRARGLRMMILYQVLKALATKRHHRSSSCRTPCIVWRKNVRFAAPNHRAREGALIFPKTFKTPLYKRESSPIRSSPCKTQWISPMIPWYQAPIPCPDSRQAAPRPHETTKSSVTEQLRHTTPPIWAQQKHHPLVAFLVPNIWEWVFGKGFTNWFHPF